jgi:hypothetical protein
MGKKEEVSLWECSTEKADDLSRRSRWAVVKCNQDVAMSTGCWRIKPSELERTLKSVRSVGLHVRSVELAADGAIKITVSDSETGEPTPETSEQLRKLL